MNIAFSKYQLFWKGDHHRQPREGALLRVKQPDGNFGYADCHPWTEFGDLPLSNQFQMLAEGKTSSLINCSLRFAQIDATARAQKQHLFAGIDLPQNHYHISTGSLLSEALLDQLARDGFNLIKIKMGANFQDDCATLKNFSKSLCTHGLKLRLDFNIKFSEVKFLDFLNQNMPYLDVIDNFEDPFPYDPVAWQQIREKHNIKLACDKDSQKALMHPHSCDFLVIKPAIQEITPFLTNELQGRKLIITSYLDHPIGQLSGLYEAANVLTKHPEILSSCGFLTHHAYEPTSFSNGFNHLEPRLVPSISGYGFGYDHLLENLNWSSLS